MVARSWQIGSVDAYAHRAIGCVTPAFSDFLDLQAVTGVNRDAASLVSVGERVNQVQ